MNVTTPSCRNLFPSDFTRTQTEFNNISPPRNAQPCGMLYLWLKSFKPPGRQSGIAIASPHIKWQSTMASKNWTSIIRSSMRSRLISLLLVHLSLSYKLLKWCPNIDKPSTCTLNLRTLRSRGADKWNRKPNIKRGTYLPKTGKMRPGRYSKMQYVFVLWWVPHSNLYLHHRWSITPGTSL